MEIHLLAKAYHWSERELLSLPVGRRTSYLLLIERDEHAALISGVAGAF
jgi:hypothetical protein